LHRTLEVDHTDSYITASKAWTYIGGSNAFRTAPTQYHPYELVPLANNDIFKKLGKFKASPAAQIMYSIEPQLIKALKSKISADYWQYLESLIPPKIVGDRANKQVKDTVSRILLLNEKITSDNRIFETLIHAFDLFNGGYDRLGVEYKAMPAIQKQMRQRQVPAPVRKLNYPFVAELLKEHDAPMDAAYYEKARQYYQGILTEAYAIRNFDVHAGTGNNRALIKIQKTLPGMIFRFRGLIFDAIKEYPNATIDIIMGMLIEKAEKLLQK